jgi:hypothetical protein
VAVLTGATGLPPEDAMDALLDRWRADLAGRPTRVILSDGDDPRTIEAALVSAAQAVTRIPELSGAR